MSKVNETVKDGNLFIFTFLNESLDKHLIKQLLMLIRIIPLWRETEQ